MHAQTHTNNKETRKAERNSKSEEVMMQSGTFLPVKAALCSGVSPILLGKLTSAPACKQTSDALVMQLLK